MTQDCTVSLAVSAPGFPYQPKILSSRVNFLWGPRLGLHSFPSVSTHTISRFRMSSTAAQRQESPIFLPTSAPSVADNSTSFLQSVKLGAAAVERGQCHYQHIEVPVPKIKEDDQWKVTLEKTINALVSIRFIVTRKFDTWNVGSYNATGFIVDVENAIILTNKHVVTDAPFIGKVCFKNSEEVPAWPLWRDPIHDFGFIRFDKSKVKFMDLQEVSLAPEAARVGLAVKVPGSDAGEKLAVLSGILARLDRDPPNYGVGTYCDFNTFYIQASANTSGGSSGSPVINLDGKAVALNAGGSVKAASSFFLPLPRIKRALDLLREGKFVPRGTLQAEFSQKQYDECRRLGIPLEIETSFRQKSPDLNGLLTIKHIIPGGPSDNILQTGDILMELDGRPISHFDELAQELDDRAPTPNCPINPKGTCTLTLFRDQRIVQVKVKVDDLHGITPSRFFEVGGAVVHSLSFQLARSFLHAAGAPFIADAGQIFGVAGIPAYSVIVSVNHVKTPDLDAFIDIMRSIPDGKRVPIRYYTLSKKNIEIVKVVLVESRWGRFRISTRDDTTGQWEYTNVGSITGLTIAAPKFNASFVRLPTSKNCLAKIGSTVLPSLVLVEWHSPLGMDGVNCKWADGIGMVVDAKTGLVLCDRATVPNAMGRIFLIFANGVHIPGKILYIDPMQNIVIIKFDVDMVSSLPIKEIEMSSRPPLAIGDVVYQCSINSVTHIPRVQETSVKGKGYFVFNDTSPPKFRQMNFDEFMTIHRPMTEEAGILTDEEGRVRAAWLRSPESSSFLGYSYTKSSRFFQVIDLVIQRERRLAAGDSSAVDALPTTTTIDVELTETYFHKARPLGLSENWITEIVNKRQGNTDYDEYTGDASDAIQDDDTRSSANSNDGDSQPIVGDDKYTVISVRRVPATEHHRAAGDHVLQEGDMIVAMNGQVVTRMTDLWTVSYGSVADSSKPLASAELIVIRDGQERILHVPRITLHGMPTMDCVHWGGAIFQIPHRTLYFTVKNIPKGVYISLLYSGSPAERDGLAACHFVTHVNNKPTPTLDAFLEAVEGSHWKKHVAMVNPIGDGWDVSSSESAVPKKAFEVELERHDSGTAIAAVGVDAATDDASAQYVHPATISTTFKFRLVSLESIAKIVTIEQCNASKRYWSSWRCQVSKSSL
ncbi:hypothetical protein SeMB42_g04409 [Synchytrium endobioticum]|uniref:PDZ domain-containing protein n=1 Tax=Synchytrium endobioticum TaxID=286115 RepID=A0A507D3L4_9FUNG|nr:hypothetical protein SeMB42_g04409 [Synchytrium endobioticum]TPX46024.1 hypothetical protein SeLEV6574_g03481 [Synchytrium endobioticum]